MSDVRNTLLQSKTAVSTGKIKACKFASRYTVDVIIIGSVSALSISINGGLGNESVANLVSRDIIADGPIFFLNSMNVDFMSADIDTYTGSGTVTVVVKAVV